MKSASKKALSSQSIWVKDISYFPDIFICSQLKIQIDCQKIDIKSASHVWCQLSDTLFDLSQWSTLFSQQSTSLAKIIQLHAEFEIKLLDFSFIEFIMWNQAVLLQDYNVAVKSDCPLSKTHICCSSICIWKLPDSGWSTTAMGTSFNTNSIYLSQYLSEFCRDYW